MTCKDCIHWQACRNTAYEYAGQDAASAYDEDICCKGVAEICANFSDKSEWVHLPVKVGEQVFVVYADEIQHTSVYSMKIESEDDHFIFIVKCMISWGGARFEKFIFGQTAFLTRKEAEKALDKQRKTLNGGKISD